VEALDEIAKRSACCVVWLLMPLSGVFGHDLLKHPTEGRPVSHDGVN
jgi:hypothetical protein